MCVKEILLFCAIICINQFGFGNSAAIAPRATDMSSSPKDAFKSFTSTVAQNGQNLANTGFDSINKKLEWDAKAIDTTNDVIGGFGNAIGTGGQKFFDLGSELVKVGTEIPTSIFGSFTKGLSSGLTSGGNLFTTTGKSAVGAVSKSPSYVSGSTQKAVDIVSSTSSKAEGAATQLKGAAVGSAGKIQGAVTEKLDEVKTETSKTVDNLQSAVTGKAASTAEGTLVAPVVPPVVAEGVSE